MRGRGDISGPGGDGPSDQEFGEFLRRSLHAAMEPVEPAGDGLERIRARLGHNWRPLAWQLAHSAVAGISELDARPRRGAVPGGEQRLERHNPTPLDLQVAVG
jgi:hypothetical protein